MPLENEKEQATEKRQHPSGESEYKLILKQDGELNVLNPGGKEVIRAIRKNDTILFSRVKGGQMSPWRRTELREKGDMSIFNAQGKKILNLNHGKIVKGTEEVGTYFCDDVDAGNVRYLSDSKMVISPPPPQFIMKANLFFAPFAIVIALFCGFIVINLADVEMGAKQWLIGVLIFGAVAAAMKPAEKINALAQFARSRYYDSRLFDFRQKTSTTEFETIGELSRRYDFRIKCRDQLILREPEKSEHRETMLLISAMHALNATPGLTKRWLSNVTFYRSAGSRKADAK